MSGYDRFHVVLGVPDFRFLEVSQNYLEMFGLTKALLGMRFRDLPLLPDKRKCELIAKLDQLVKTGIPFIAWDEVGPGLSLVRWVNIGLNDNHGKINSIKCTGKIVKERRKTSRHQQDIATGTNT